MTRAPTLLESRVAATDLRPVRILTIADPAVQFVLFMRNDGSAEAVLTHPDRPTKPTRHEIPPAPAGQRIVMTRYPTGEVEVMYRAEIRYDE
jgi:hypothetical protein